MAKFIWMVGLIAFLSFATERRSIAQALCWVRAQTDCEQEQVFCFTGVCGAGSVGNQCNSAFVNDPETPATVFWGAKQLLQGDGEELGEFTGPTINCGQHYACYCELFEFLGYELTICSRAVPIGPFERRSREIGIQCIGPPSTPPDTP